MTKTITMPLEEYEKMRNENNESGKLVNNLQSLASHLYFGVERLLDQVDKSDFKDENGHSLKQNKLYLEVKEFVGVVAGMPIDGSVCVRERLLKKGKEEQFQKEAINIVNNITIHGAQKSPKEMAQELVEKIKKYTDVGPFV